MKNSSYARILGLDPTFKANDPVYAAIDTVMSDPQRRAAVLNFLAYLRAKVLREDYNMNPGVMYEFTRDIGPLDWRHAQAHALYWARLGTERGAKRYEGVEDVHKVINNDRIWLQAMQALARSGLLAWIRSARRTRDSATRGGSACDRQVLPRGLRQALRLARRRWRPSRTSRTS